MYFADLWKMMKRKAYVGKALLVLFPDALQQALHAFVPCAFFMWRLRLDRLIHLWQTWHLVNLHMIG